MRIYAAQGPNGQANFNVEEYKRPKFQVALDPPKTAAKLNDKVSLAGHAMPGRQELRRAVGVDVQKRAGLAPLKALIGLSRVAPPP